MNVRWLVKFDNQPYKDEEMYERAFKSLIHSASGKEENSEDKKRTNYETITTDHIELPTSSHSATKGTVGKNDTTKASGCSSSEGEEKGGGSLKYATRTAKSVQFQSGTDDDSPEEHSTGASRSSRNRVSQRQREARSRRRQAKMDEAAETDVTPSTSGSKRRQLQASGNSKSPKVNEQCTNNDEVVKVMFKTGTLYLYRGARRRVEFVRRV